MSKRALGTGGMGLWTFWAAFVVLLGSAVPATMTAQECQIPLFVQEGIVPANVMILFDSSGSMNSAMYHREYDAFAVYDGTFTGTSTYNIASPGVRTPASFNSAWPTEPSAFLVNSDNGQSARYTGNYLNWIYYHATPEQRDAIPLFTRVQVAKIVMADVVSHSNGVRFGLTRFNGSTGGTIVAPCGASDEFLIDSLYAITASGWTPLAESMENILNYFKNPDTGPIEARCQYNFLIVMTDGYPTQDTEVSPYLWDADNDGNDPGNCESIGSPDPNSNLCSDHMDDVAYYMRHEDLRSDLGEPDEVYPDGQHVITYTVGFGIDASILGDTAVNGDGLYFLASDAVELWLSLELVIMDIITRISSGAAVAVVSTERGDDDKLYRGKFMPGSWEGYLEAFQLPYEQGDPNVWEAGWILSNRSPDSREILTAIGNNIMEFRGSYASELMYAMDLPEPELAAEVITWARGHEVDGYRAHNGWVLGDIIHSTPVIVGAPSNFIADEEYQAFLEYYSDRPKMVYVGANDGMLHAFFADSGDEAWAFVPEFALPKLKEIAAETYCHLYACDQTPNIRDVKIDGVWRTVLIGSGREGGASYFALDITEGVWPEVLWQVELPNGKSFSSEAEFAYIQDTTVALIGSGLDEASGEAIVYAYDISNGQLLGSQMLSSAVGTRNKATKPRAVDRDLDGQTDLIYTGDLLGNVYRISANETNNPSSWDVTTLFAGDQPITAEPVPAFGEEDRVYIYFGTGAYLQDPDISDHDPNSFYCVYDSHSGNTLDRFDLVDNTDGGSDIGDAPGWYVDLWNQPAGERVSEKAVVVAGTVFFTSFAPSADPCEAGGHSWLYRLAYDDGSEAEDEEGDGTGQPRSEDLGDGVASRPVVDIVNEKIIVQSSDATITVEDIGMTFFHLNVRSWQENYDFVVEEIPPPPNDP